jgi:hypothetical protein
MNLFQKMFIAVVVLTSATLPASGQTTYYTGFNTAAEQTGWTNFRKNAAASTYSWEVNSGGYGSSGNCLRHDYPVGASTVTEDWYISPPFDFSAGGKIDSLRTSFSGFSTPSPGDTVGIYLITGSATPTLATSRIKLFDFRGSEYNNDGSWRLKTNITIPNKSGQSYLAFKYTTTNAWLDVRFDNLRVKINSPVGVKEANVSRYDISVYPNPCAESIMFNSNVPLADEAGAVLRIDDINGQVQVNEVITFNQPYLHRLAPGVYFYQLSNNQQSVLKRGKVIVKNE